MSEQDIDEEVARILCQVKEKGILSSLEELQPLKNYNYETEENQLEDNYLEQNQISNYNQELEHVEEGIVYSDSGKEELEDGEIEDREIEEYNNQEDDYENENKDLEYDELHKREDSDNGNHHVEVINLSTGDPDNLDQIDNIGLEEADLQELLEIEEEAMNEEEHEALSQSQTSIPVDFYNYPPLEVRPLSRITQHSPPGIDIYRRPLFFQEQLPAPPSFNSRFELPQIECLVYVAEIGMAEYQLFWDRQLGPFRCARPSKLRRSWTRI